MNLGIDASNIRAGGGVTHLLELLRAVNPLKHGFSQVIVWSGKATLDRLEDRPWLVKSHQSLLDKALPCRTFWQRFRLSELTRAANCDVLFVPGGSYAGNFRPVVTMSQNLLPFEWQELRRFGWSLFTLKMMLLRWTQSRTFCQADGVVFLTEYAKDAVMRVIKSINGKTTIIPHGIDKRFACPPREQLPVSRYSIDRPFRILYVSIIEVYKHQWHVAEAVAQLWESGLPVALDLVGPASSPSLKRLRATLERIDPASEFIRYVGAVPYSKLHTRYAQADLCLFASSCENLPNILIEGMASGLPVACSNRGPMPEVLGNAGVYFDPERPAEIAAAIRKLFDSPELRSRLACESFEKVQEYSWERCADETFSFIVQVADTKQAFDPINKID
jgi:glycosyltransferase involved in cell wall biosynthesis